MTNVSRSSGVGLPSRLRRVHHQHEDFKPEGQFFQIIGAGEKTHQHDILCVQGNNIQHSLYWHILKMHALQIPRNFSTALYKYLMIKLKQHLQGEVLIMKR